MTEEEKNVLKDVEYYSATVNAWYNSSLEHDKSLLTLSTGGIGFLITILTTIGASSNCQLVLYALAILAFATCLIAILRIFNANKIHLESIVQNIAQPDDPKLKKLDTIAFYSFILAIIISAIIGLSTATHTFNKEIEMASDKTNKSFNSSTSVPVATQDSFNGAAKLQPTTESFNGALNLRPPTPSTPQIQPTATNTTAPSTAIPPSATSQP